ncbi:hypothetical protein J6590_079301 [Homalodisca vitripennis]|nr:hypothetical protein J6590_079301 [Homalodisca vitripennis]
MLLTKARCVLVWVHDCSCERSCIPDGVHILFHTDRTFKYQAKLSNVTRIRIAGSVRYSGRSDNRIKRKDQVPHG